jgi:hypothetical protein
MPIKFINEKALAPMLRPVQWTEDAAPHRRGTFAAQVLEGESQSQSAGPTLDPLTANPWTVRVPAALPQNALAAYVKMGDSLTLAAGVTLTVQQITRALDGYLVMRCTSEERAPTP